MKSPADAGSAAAALNASQSTAEIISCLISQLLLLTTIRLRAPFGSRHGNAEDAPVRVTDCRIFSRSSGGFAVRLQSVPQPKAGNRAGITVLPFPSAFRRDAIEQACAERSTQKNEP
jgi:hypothetical protein